MDNPGHQGRFARTNATRDRDPQRTPIADLIANIAE
jgi:hypothetical protein